MRFMIIVKATKDSEAGAPPDAKLLSEMGAFAEELIKAGVLVDGNGLAPSKKAARVRIGRGRRTVIDGPFTESKELIAGYSIWECGSLEEAIEWGKRWPEPQEGADAFEIEIRPIQNLAHGDFPDATEAVRDALDDMGARRAKLEASKNT